MQGGLQVSQPSIVDIVSKACFKTCGFRFTIAGGLEGASPPRNALFLGLAEPRLCQTQKRDFCGGGYAAPAPPPNCKVSLKHALDMVLTNFTVWGGGLGAGFARPQTPTLGRCGEAFGPSTPPQL